MNFSQDFEERHYQIPDYLHEIDQQFGNAICQVAYASDELFLDGVKLFDVVKHRFFRDIYEECGYGQCYEAAALAMFCLRKNRTARLIQGTGECRHSTKERCDHAWVEFFEDGVPFVADFAWFEDEFCIPRIVHVDIAKSLAYYTLSYDDFWNNEFTRELFRLMHEKKTSNIYPWLFFYRSPKNEFGLPILKKLSKGLMQSEKFRPTGEEKQYLYFHEQVFDGKNLFRPATLKTVI